MTTHNLVRRAIKNFQTFQVPKHVRRSYQRQWIESVQRLGDRWLLAKTISKGAKHEGA